MAERTFSEGTRLPDGRKVRILAYDDGSVRFRLDDPPYFLEEAFLAGGTSQHAIVKLTPRQTTGSESGVGEGGHPLQQLKEGVENLRRQAKAAPLPEGKGAYKNREFLKGLDAGLVVAGMWIDQLIAGTDNEPEDHDSPGEDLNE